MNSKYLKLVKLFRSIKTIEAFNLLYTQLSKNGFNGLKKDWDTLNNLEKKSLVKRIQRKENVLQKL